MEQKMIAETLAQRLIKERTLAEERYCEMSLTDPRQRGVLIIEHTALAWSISLSSDVPWGQMHIRKEWPR